MSRVEGNEFGVCHWIYPFITQLLKGPTGFCVGGLKIEDPISSAPARPGHYGSNENDIFNVAVPLAGDIVRWQFIFDGSNPDVPPDIILPDYEDFDPEFDNISSLAHWDKHKQDSLLSAVQQIISLYKEHHKTKCFNLGEKFKEELEELYEYKEGFNIEVSFKKSERTGNQRVVNVLVQLPADISSIVEKDLPMDVVIHTPLLLIKREIDIGKTTSNLFLPSHVEQVLLPPLYTPDTSLLEYVVKTNERLKDSIKIISESRSKRCEYVAAFLRLFPEHTIEYDAEKFQQITLLFSFQTFYFFIHVNLSKFFPNELPVITFQSAYHLNKRNQLHQVVCTNYPYSPRWNGSEMAKRAKAFIQEKIPQFKENCIKNGIL